MRTLIAVLLLALSATALSQDEYRTEALSEVDRAYMAQITTRLDNLARENFGNRFSGEINHDLELLQRMLDRKLVRQDDRELLQGMGMVLGNFLREKKGLQWVVYVDKKGRSRALEIPGTGEFLFPVTMISRRYEAGAEVDVQALFENATDIVEEIRRRPVFRPGS